MRLLMSGMSGSKGGKETYIVGMTRELLKLGDVVDFITVDVPMAYEDEMISLGCRIHHIPRRNEDPIGHRKAITHILSSTEYDVVWSHKTTLSSIDDLELAKNTGVPVRIIHSHCTKNMGGKMTALMHSVNRRRVGKIANRYYACSQAAGEYFFPPRVQFQVVRNAFDVKKYAFDVEARKRVRKELGIDKDAFVLCHVGRFSPEKNHSKIMHVFASVNSSDNDSVLLLCGDGPTRQSIESLAAELGIAGRVLFLGAVDNIASILSSSDVFIFPSIHEGMPYALLEAQANGLPCIVSNSIDCIEFEMETISSLGLSESDDKWAEKCRSLWEKRTTTPNKTLYEQFNLAKEAMRIHNEIHQLK